MCRKAIIFLLPMVLLAQSPAFAKEHISTLSLPSIVYILIWILLTWGFMGLLSNIQGPRGVFAVASVVAAIVGGEFVEGLLGLVGINLGNRTVARFACICVVNILVQGAALIWAGPRLFNRSVSLGEALKVVVVPAVLSTVPWFAFPKPAWRAGFDSVAGPLG